MPNDKEPNISDILSASRYIRADEDINKNNINNIEELFTKGLENMEKEGSERKKTSISEGDISVSSNPFQIISELSYTKEFDKVIDNLYEHFSDTSNSSNASISEEAQREKIIKKLKENEGMREIYISAFGNFSNLEEIKKIDEIFYDYMAAVYSVKINKKMKNETRRISFEEIIHSLYINKGKENKYSLFELKILQNYIENKRDNNINFVADLDFEDFEGVLKETREKISSIQKSDNLPFKERQLKNLLELEKKEKEEGVEHSKIEIDDAVLSNNIIEKYTDKKRNVASLLSNNYVVQKYLNPEEFKLLSYREQIKRLKQTFKEKYINKYFVSSDSFFKTISEQMTKNIYDTSNDILDINKKEEIVNSINEEMITNFFLDNNHLTFEMRNKEPFASYTDKEVLEIYRILNSTIDRYIKENEQNFKNNLGSKANKDQKYIIKMFTDEMTEIIKQKTYDDNLDMEKRKEFEDVVNIDLKNPIDKMVVDYGSDDVFIAKRNSSTMKKFIGEIYLNITDSNNKKAYNLLNLPLNKLIAMVNNKEQDEMGIFTDIRNQYEASGYLNLLKDWQEELDINNSKIISEKIKGKSVEESSNNFFENGINRDTFINKYKYKFEINSEIEEDKSMGANLLFDMIRATTANRLDSVGKLNGIFTMNNPILKRKPNSYDDIITIMKYELEKKHVGEYTEIEKSYIRVIALDNFISEPGRVNNLEAFKTGIFDALRGNEIKKTISDSIGMPTLNSLVMWRKISEYLPNKKLKNKNSFFGIPTGDSNIPTKYVDILNRNNKRMIEIIKDAPDNLLSKQIKAKTEDSVQISELDVEVSRDIALTVSNNPLTTIVIKEIKKPFYYYKDEKNQIKQINVDNNISYIWDLMSVNNISYNEYLQTFEDNKSESNKLNEEEFLQAKKDFIDKKIKVNANSFVCEEISENNIKNIDFLQIDEKYNKLYTDIKQFLKKDILPKEIEEIILDEDYLQKNNFDEKEVKNIFIDVVINNKIKKEDLLQLKENNGELIIDKSKYIQKNIKEIRYDNNRTIIGNVNDREYILINNGEKPIIQKQTSVLNYSKRMEYQDEYFNIIDDKKYAIKNIYDFDYIKMMKKVEKNFLITDEIKIDNNELKMTESFNTNMLKGYYKYFQYLKIQNKSYIPDMELLKLISSLEKAISSGEITEELKNVLKNGLEKDYIPNSKSKNFHKYAKYYLEEVGFINPDGYFISDNGFKYKLTYNDYNLLANGFNTIKDLEVMFLNKVYTKYLKKRKKFENIKEKYGNDKIETAYDYFIFKRIEGASSYKEALRLINNNRAFLNQQTVDKLEKIISKKNIKDIVVSASKVLKTIKEKSGEKIKNKKREYKQKIYNINKNMSSFFKKYLSNPGNEAQTLKKSMVKFIAGYSLNENKVNKDVINIAEMLLNEEKLKNNNYAFSEFDFMLFLNKNMSKIIKTDEFSSCKNNEEKRDLLRKKYEEFTEVPNPKMEEEIKDNLNNFRNMLVELTTHTNNNKEMVDTIEMNENVEYKMNETIAKSNIEIHMDNFINKNNLPKEILTNIKSILKNYIENKISIHEFDKQLKKELYLDSMVARDELFNLINGEKRLDMKRNLLLIKKIKNPNIRKQQVEKIKNQDINLYNDIKLEFERKRKENNIPSNKKISNSVQQ